MSITSFFHSLFSRRKSDQKKEVNHLPAVKEEPVKIKRTITNKPNTAKYRAKRKILADISHASRAYNYATQGHR